MRGRGKSGKRATKARVWLSPYVPQKQPYVALLLAGVVECPHLVRVALVAGGGHVYFVATLDRGGLGSGPAEVEMEVKVEVKVGVGFSWPG